MEEDYYNEGCGAIIFVCIFAWTVLGSIAKLTGDDISWYLVLAPVALYAGMFVTGLVIDIILSEIEIRKRKKRNENLLKNI